MNATKVLFKSKEELKNFVQKKYESAPAGFSFLLEEESQNLYFKGLFLDRGVVVSDRKMRTLRSELYRQITQDFGFRVVRDEHLAYYLFDTKTPKLHKKMNKYLRLMSSIPDYFFDLSFKNLLDEYIEQSENIELQNLKADLLFCENLYKSIIDNKIVSASTTLVLLDKLEFSDETLFIMESLFDRLPQVLKDKLSLKENINLLCFEKKLDWNGQIDLFEKVSDLERIFLYSFENPIEEVRYILDELSKTDESSIVLIPKSKGYENLFNSYQREFNEDFEISKKIEKRSKLIKALERFEISLGSATPYQYLGGAASRIDFTDFKAKNTNRLNIKKSSAVEEDKERTFIEFLDLISEEIDIEENLDFISELQISLPTDLSISTREWLELIKASLPSQSKSVKLTSQKHKFQYIDESINEDFQNIFICGWNDSMFRPKVSAVISQKSLSLLEKDLGFKTWSIENSVAKKLFSDLSFVSGTSKIRLCLPEQDLEGRISEKGVFNHLLERKLNIVEEKVVRHHLAEPLDLAKHEWTKNETYKISASSLSLYDDCPFKFYMHKVLDQQIESPENYFLDPLKEGSLIHDLLEKFLQKPITKDQFVTEVEKMSLSSDQEFDKFRPALIESIAEKLWEILRSEKNFIESSGVKVESLEKSFSFSCNLKKKTFSQSEPNAKFLLRGKIDRIDQDKEDNILIYDYKRGKSGISTVKNYSAKELKPQLFIYCLAASEGFLNDFNKLVGFQYISIKDQKRSGGYLNADFKGTSLIKEATNQIFLSDDDFKNKMNLFLDKFWKVLEDINAGQFNPQPKKHETCVTCEWKAICRKSETFL